MRAKLNNKMLELVDKIDLEKANLIFSKVSLTEGFILMRKIFHYASKLLGFYLPSSFICWRYSGGMKVGLTMAEVVFQITSFRPPVMG